MTISFTDDQVKKLSLDYIQFPQNLAEQIQGRADVVVTQDQTYAEDQGNKQWTDFYLERVIDKYHQELKFLDSEERTLYIGESLIDGAARRKETHFPTSPVWVHLPPKLINSQKGLPTSVYTGVVETNSIAGLSTAKYLISSGFNDGGDSADLSSGYTIGQTSIFVDDVTDFSVGNRILVISGSIGMFAVIDNIIQDAGFCTGGSGSTSVECVGNGGTWTQPPSGEFEITVLTPPSSNLPSGASVQNSASGFSNGEREGTSGLTPQRESVLNIFKSILDNAVQAWEDQIKDVVKPQLVSNEDQKRKSDTEAEIARIDNRISEIDSWQSFPSLKQFGPTVESRFGDIKLSELEASYDGRSTEITNRLSFIDTALDTLSQDGSDSGKGSFLGSGVYYDYFDWFNKRVNAAQGSLSRYYGIDIAIEVIDQTIANLNSSKDETETVMRVEAISQDADGTQVVYMSDTTGFSSSDTVKVVANDQPIITTTIISVGIGSIILTASIPINYSLDNIVRLVKEL